jgi:hypothetical protein
MDASYDLGTRLSAAFSRTSAISLAILDSQWRFRFVNKALIAMHSGVPVEAFIGSTICDILRDAAPDVEARLERASVAGETAAVEVGVKLPSRTELGHWIEKNFAITHKSGKVIQIASLGVEVTKTRKLEQYFRNLGGERLWKDEEYEFRARELHNAVDQYHAALGRNLDGFSRCTREPENIPELVAQSMILLDEEMRNLAAVIAKCFPVDLIH